MKWISVNERLPRNEQMVLAYTPCDGFMFVGYYFEETYGSYHWEAWRIITAMRSTKIVKKKVSYWMPLPAPPKEE